MQQRHVLLGSLVVAMVSATSMARADEVPLRDERAPVGERTFYNHAERNKAHRGEDNRVSYRTADTGPYEPERVRNFYVVPFLGFEVATLGARLYTAGPGVDVERTRADVGYAPAFGLNLGWRLGYFNIGARYQGSVFVDPDYRRLSLNKFYAEIGFNTRARVLLFQAFLAGGYAFAATPDNFANGVGGKIGFNLDFLVNRFFSIGPGFSFDVHAYRPADPWQVAYGGTAQLRLGFHI